MERWRESYRDAPDVFDALSRAEDPDGRLAATLSESAGLAGREVLEVGCGSGHHSRRLARTAARWLAVEPAPALARLAARRLAEVGGSVVRGRGQALPVADAAVDAVVATWVLAYLPRRVRDAVLGEALRVLRPTGAVWLVENHWQSELQELRGKAGAPGRAELAPLVDGWGFRVAATVETEIVFASTEQARRVLGWLCGDTAERALTERPRRRIGHRIVLLRKE